MVFDYYGTNKIDSCHNLHTLAVFCAKQQEAEFSAVDADCDL
jgi:hypothetical protein